MARLALEASDPAAHLSAEVDRICAHLRTKGNAYTIAVFVTPDGMFFAAPSGRRAYSSLAERYGPYEIGHYNRRIQASDLRDDIIFAAHQVRGIDRVSSPCRLGMSPRSRRR